ncbi:MAG: peptidase dimerization domain-containing protein [Alistipes finegoldii]
MRPAASYTRDPYAPTVEDGKLYGLGSNDAEGLRWYVCWRLSQVPHASAALQPRAGNLGRGGVHGRKRHPRPAARPGESGHGAGGRTDGDAGRDEAIGGLVVLDYRGARPGGHAARGEGVNALYIALDDIARLRSFRFGRESELLGPIGIAVTQIEAGTQHNVCPTRAIFDQWTSARRTPTRTEETVGMRRPSLRRRAAVDAHPRRGGRRGNIRW